ncbi:gliding motility-associated C-terminal domain-containing protein [Runella sp.]|uniref:gliding motility-associated C-terminal domain-containing protein n=1 Tax=Runella sp. TaxID=1960881 RepID=UPI00262F886A|nr:gliding motility-associated C-terminal domain-containing protein [Runella sp.]
MFTIPLISECGKFVSETTIGKDTFFGGKEIGNHKSMKSYLLFFCFLSILQHSYGQNYCDTPPAGTSKGGFKVNNLDLDPVRVCAGTKITVQNTTALNVQYNYNYTGGDPKPADFTATADFTYLRQGSYRILQLGSNGSGSVACKSVEVYYPPNFTVKACSGGKVQVTIPADSSTQRYDEFIINWGGNVTSKLPKAATMVASFSYPANTNAATISVVGSVAGQSLGCSKPSTSVILSTTNLSAVAIRKVAARTDGLVDVLVKGSQGATAEVQVNDGSGTFKNTGQLMTTNDTTTITVRDVNANKNTYCFRLSANDGCDNAAVISNEVCSTNLDAVAQNRQNALSWKEYPKAAGFQSYRLTRNSVSLGGISTITTTTTIDRNVTCNEQYCYQMTVLLANGVESVSPLRCVKAISNETPSVVQNAFVSVLETEQKIELRATPPASGTTPAKFKTIFLRAENGSSDFKEVGVKDNTLTFQDDTADPAAQSYCYKIQYENSCGNRSEPTEPICSIRLYSNTNTTVDWTAESPFLMHVGVYWLEVYNEQGDPVQEEPLGGNTSFDPSLYNPDQQLFHYRIKAYPSNKSLISFSNFYVFTRDAIVFIPDAFSPNGDNMNDKFAPKGQFMDKSRLIIYNRWGQVLFETANAIEGWDGTVNGQPAVEGTYVYRLEITDSLGKYFVKTGTMLLAR